MMHSVKPAPKSPSVPSHATIELRLAKNFSHCHPILGKTDAVWRHVTAYDYAEPFHVHHMDQISYDAESEQLPSPHLCQAMPLLGSGWHKYIHITTQSWAKLMLFGGM
jgi:hypothetical protein